MPVNIKKLFQVASSTFRGSAIILILVIMGLMATLSLFIARGSVRETRIVGAGEAAQGAYYSAEAGIEDGLARLAADRNLEVPTCAFGKTHPAPNTTLSCDETDNANFNSNLNISDVTGSKPLSWPDRIRLARFGNAADPISDKNNQDCANAAACAAIKADGDVNQAVEGNSTAAGYIDPTKAPKEFLYDLKITSKVLFYGNATGATPQSPGNLIKKGNFVELGVGHGFSGGVRNQQAPDQIQIWWNCSGGACAAGDQISFKLIFDPIAGNSAETTLDFSPNNLTAGGSFTYTGFNNNQANLKQVRVSAPNKDINVSIVFTKGPIGNPTPVLFSGDKIKVQSVGYYGGIKRRLEADVDRRSGALLGLFDFAVYAGTSFTQPQ